MADVLTELTALLEQRKNAESDTSYVAELHKKGINKILEKVGEESTEAILAAKDFDIARQSPNANTDTERKALISETADLWFHTLVMLSHLDSNADDVIEELGRRFGVSGLDEKAARK